MLTDSTSFLTSAQAAARLGVKRSTLYAYVSRGLLRSHRAPDGRRSLFEPADLARLERRSERRHGAPTDVIVGSELALVDPAARSLWYRGVDALELARQHPFEQVCALLWTDDVERTLSWEPDARTLRAAIRAMRALPSEAPVTDRLSMAMSSVAVSHSTDHPPDVLVAATDIMSTVVRSLPGATGEHPSFAASLWHALTERDLTPRWSDALDATLSLLSAPRITHASLAVRMSAANGAGLAAAVTAGALAGIVPVAAYAAIESALATAATDGVMRAADVLDPSLTAEAFSRDPYRSGDPRTLMLFTLLDVVAPSEVETARALADELRRRGADHPTASYVAATLSWASGMPPGSGAVIARLANVAGWIAHALEEYRLPTPYRPRLAYTGRSPRPTPRRPLDAVQNYLARL